MKCILALILLAGTGLWGRPAAAGPSDWAEWIRATLYRQAALRSKPDWKSPEETLAQLTKKVTGELNYLTEALLLHYAAGDPQHPTAFLSSLVTTHASASKGDGLSLQNVSVAGDASVDMNAFALIASPGPVASSPTAGPAAAPAPTYAALGSFAQPGFAAISSGSFLLTQNNTMPPTPPAGQTESLDNLVVNVPNCFTDFCCEMNVTGTGVLGGIASAAMACVPGPTNSDAASMPLIYMGDALYALSAAFSGMHLWISDQHLS
ncbi:hypothetical protein WJX74_003311 [Apatococcus lobatus]|uniref:Uncharacterized protein n=1 Tax=Apatococcus lobatus TaxID=904363 RepID=A0AAW1SBA7_9CHLO